ncbi:winged helix-turn-helix domain-containing protein [Lacibacterium aquatile]|uniref:Winged helix-turn-helix domain-containing protein n=1 Tax=Lacibacterium aquatile TaxID=1168082 RepID=A0ABW5DQF3_9PROT
MRILFGDCVLDTARRELLRGDEPVRIEPQVFDLLLHLIENRDRVVSKDDLLEAVWQGRIVSESTLSNRINAARVAVGDNGDQQSLIRTMARRGFRFIGEALVEGVAPAPTPSSDDPRPRVAVLPFVNMSGSEEQEYFADGLTEDVITDLSRVSALFVVARNTVFTLKGKAVDVPEAARLLRVDHVLEGSVRAADGRVRITAQLIDGQTGGHLWAERYDREMREIFSLQDEISHAIVAALKIALLPQEKTALDYRPTSNSEAYQYYLMARSYFLQPGYAEQAFRTARQFYAKAIAADPTYARAYAGIANCDSYLMCMGAPDVTYQQIMANAARALDLEPELAEAHAARGLALYAAGQHSDADTTLERAVRLGSLSFEAHFFTARNCRAQGRHQQAAALFERAGELQPNDFRSIGLALDSYRALGWTEKAQDAAHRCLERARAEVSVHPSNALALAFGTGVLAYLGQTEEANIWADRAAALDTNDVFASYNLATALVTLKRFDMAMERLYRVFDIPPPARKCHVDWLKSDPCFVPMRGHPPFDELVSRLEAEKLAPAKIEDLRVAS